jgi:peroxiredoxin
LVAEADIAPDFTLPDPGGNEMTLSELRGQPVVLDFTLLADSRT